TDLLYYLVFFFQAEDGIRDRNVTGVQTCALPIWKAPRSMTMSISVAPSATAWRVSTSLASRGARPDGNAVATEATSTPVPRRAVTALATMSGYTHTAPTVGTVRSAGSGWAALVHSARTLPGVSAPSRVVRSTMEMARSMAVALVVVLTDRVDRSLARAAAPTSSTPGSPYRYARSERLVIASGAVVVWGTGTFRVELCAGRPVRCGRRVRDLVGPFLQK